MDGVVGPYRIVQVGVGLWDGPKQCGTVWGVVCRCGTVWDGKPLGATRCSTVPRSILREMALSYAGDARQRETTKPSVTCRPNP